MALSANEAMRVGAIGIALTGALYLASRFGGGGSTDGRGLVREPDEPSAKAVATGAPSKATGAALWARTFVASAGGGGARIAGVATTRGGEVVIAGSFAGAIALGGDTLTSAGEDDVFVAKLDREGRPLWSKRFGGPGFQNATGVAVAPDGAVVVSGTLDQKTDFGGGELASAGMIDVFCLKLDEAGRHVWSRRFGDEHEQEAGAVAVGADGSVVLAGSYEGKLDFGSGPLESAGEDDVFVAKLDASGKELWSRRFGDARAQKARAVAIAPDGRVVVTGTDRGTLALGKLSIDSPDADTLYAFALDAAGAPLWARAAKAEPTAIVNPRGLALDGDGNAVIVASLRGRAELAGTRLDDRGAEGAAFVARFGPNGDPGWAAPLGDGRPIEVAGVAVGREGDAVVATSPLGVLDARPHAAGDEAAIVRVDRKGRVTATQRLGEEPSAALGVALDASGRVLVAGTTRAPVDAMAGPLTGLTAVVLELRR
jgi:hypothetical protein